METQRGPLGLRIPVHSLNVTTSVNLSPAAIMAWRTILPMADLSVSAKKIYHTLSESNKVVMATQERFEVLEILRPSVQYICQAIRKHYLLQNSKLPNDSILIAKFAHTLQMQMIEGYKIVLEQLAANPNLVVNNTVLPTVVQRLMFFHSQVALRCYQLYWNLPALFWQEVNIVYKYAELNNIHHIESLKNPSPSDRSCEEIYKQILIMSAIGSYQWRQAELDILYNASEYWVDEISLSAYKAQAFKGGVYYINLVSDLGPSQVAMQRITPASTCRVLNLNPIIEQLKSYLAHADVDNPRVVLTSAKGSHFEITLPMLRRLVKTWETLPVRTAKRVEENSDVLISIGFNSTHHHLNNEQPFLFTSDSPDSFTSKLNQESSENVAFVIEEDNIQIEAITEGAIGSDDKQNLCFQAKIIDKSDNGCYVEIKNSNYLSIQTGDVIGLKKITDSTEIIDTEEKGNGWEIGVARWIKHTSQNEVRLGVEILATKADAVGIEIIRDSQPSGKILRAIALPRNDAAGRKSSIITPSTPFKLNTSVNIIYINKNETIVSKLIKLVEVTANFKIFEFSLPLVNQTVTALKKKRMENEKLQPKKSISESSTQTGEFDSIWPIL